MNSATTLRAIALEHPATIRVFEHFQLDYCCGGNRPLGEVCAEKCIAAEVVLAALNEAVHNEPAAEDFTRATPTQLIRYIVQTHHAYVRSELPRLQSMAERVASKHGPLHPEATFIQRSLTQLAEELTFHLNKEERILFPYIEGLERSRGENTAPPSAIPELVCLEAGNLKSTRPTRGPNDWSLVVGVGATGSRQHSNEPQRTHLLRNRRSACFGSVESPIRQMIHEHEGAAGLLEEMRTATHGFITWPGACPTTGGLYYGLKAFEADLHRHVHLENNLLFPRAIELEQELLTAQ